MKTFNVSLEEEKAWAFAQFLKRVGWQEIRENAVDEDEAYVMKDAIYEVMKALAEEGVSPR